MKCTSHKPEESPAKNVIMAKLEIPSIVVNSSGSTNSMEKIRSSKNRLSKQDEFEEVEEDASSPEITCEDKEKISNLKDRKNDRDATQKSEKNSEEPEPCPGSQHRSHPKVKLLQRSQAVRDDTSPPPDMELPISTLSVTTSNISATQNKCSTNKHHKLGKQGSSQSSMDGCSPCLSRDSSLDQYTDSTGIDLHQFIVDTLHRNQKDRILLLKIEQELGSFVKDNKRQYQKFPQMSSYQRMLVHRVAAYFGMEHNVDQAGTSVVVNKTKNTRLPEKKFRDLIRDELVPEEPKKSILKRDSSSFEEGKDSSSSQEGPVDSPVRSHEGTHNSSRRSSQEDLRWVTDPRPWSSTDSDSSNRPVKPVITKTSASTESDASTTSSRHSRGILTKAESAENHETLHLRSRPPNMSKASSFGGISVLVRGDSITSTRSATPRLTKAESFSSSSACGNSSHRLSPSCPKNENISAVSPSSNSGPSSPQEIPTTLSVTQISDTSSFTNCQTRTNVVPTTAVSNSSQNVWPTSTASAEMTPPNFVQGQPVMWAVSNMEAVPPGSILINPQTGQPYLNADGSVYRHGTPSTLPVLQPVTNAAPSQPTSNQNVVQQLQQLVSHLSAQTQPLHQSQNSASLQHQVPAQVQVSLQPQPLVPSPSAPAPAAPPPPPPPPPSLLPPVVLYTQLINQPQTHLAEQRHFTLENNVGELANSMSSLSFPHSLSNDAGGSGDGNQVIPSSSVQYNPHGFYMTTMRPAGLVPTTQGNVAQPVRVVYPVPFLSSQTQQSHQSTNPIIAGQQQQQTSQLSQQQTQHQPSAQVAPLHNPGDSLHHPPSQSQLPGQYVQSYPLVGYSQVPNQPSGDSFSISPYYQMTSPSLSAVSGVTSVPTFSSYSTPSSLGASSVVSSNISSINTSQSPFMASNVPVYGPMTAVAPNPGITQGGFPHSQGSYRSQTPPAQAPGGQTLGLGVSPAAQIPQGLALNSPYMGYSMFPPTQSTQVQQTNPTSSTQTVPGQSSLFPAFSQPVLTATFPMFRPGMQLMTVRSSTPPPPPPPPAPLPPHGLLQSQYNSGSLLTKSYSLPADHRFGKTATELYLQESSSLPGNHNQDKNMVTGLSSITNSVAVRTPTHLYGRGLLLQSDLRLLGSPLQHQLATTLRTPIVLPQQRPLNRFQTPPPAVSSNLNRPPKMRKQRGRISGSKTDCASLTPQTSVDLPDNSWGHILEVQSLPESLKRSEAERYLEEITTYGGKLHFSHEGSVSVAGHSAGDFVVSGKYQVFVTFQSDTEAQSALVNIKTTKFQLRLLSQKPPLELQKLNSNVC